MQEVTITPTDWDNRNFSAEQIEELERKFYEAGGEKNGAGLEIDGVFVIVKE